MRQACSLKKKRKNKKMKGKEAVKNKRQMDGKQGILTSMMRHRCSSSFRRSGSGGSRYACPSRNRITYKKEVSFRSKSRV